MLLCAPYTYARVSSPQILPEAAYLYDAVHLYAWSLNETLKSGGNPRNGTAIIGRLLNRSYFSAMG